MFWAHILVHFHKHISLFGRTCWPSLMAFKYIKSSKLATDIVLNIKILKFLLNNYVSLYAVCSLEQTHFSSSLLYAFPLTFLQVVTGM